MPTSPADQDAIVIGGGFYGSVIAVYLARQRGLRHIALIEREPALLRRASHNNQARVHNGYHYPRSFTTAYRSRVNLPRFVRQWPEAVKQDFTKLYAIARQNSKVTARQFERFCREIGARLQPATPTLRALFEPHLIEDVFMVEEYAFDATRLAGWAERELQACGVRIRYETQATAIYRGANGTLQVTTETSRGVRESLSCRYLFNCTYSGLNQFQGDFSGTRTGLKQEIAEIALVRMPSTLQGLGITVMDGPFFSLMPFPSRGLHSLSHVRYTPHLHWDDAPGIDPYRRLEGYAHESRVDRMLRDVARYMPGMLEATPVDSLFEVKTVLIKNEGDDGRPILFEQHHELPGCYSVLGGKIDNIYDVLDRLDEQEIA
ncbi:FAD-dependent oxidoreductase [Azotobacter chroococcum]|uniref:FAD-dependent oxidoreductase n=1 Tax=Azotobacter chroococcum TaxID=353 RepID=A0AA43Z8U5_9GAMM|nr:FAD-dependent oxidoreductase [Azotobacter chroococcum]NHN78316.1 FAD-dependent oxidoreductase [Azotobacter chroococcum]